jgi:pullulanase/glycogen debranching enzyme
MATLIKTPQRELHDYISEISEQSGVRAGSPLPLGTLERDLVSYLYKHNEANGASNHDGADANFGQNYGSEGETTDAAIESVRKRQIKNFLLTLFISRGVPMLLGGDEFRRTQGGNNNAYCQDNETSRGDWGDLETASGDLLVRPRDDRLSLRASDSERGEDLFAAGEEMAEDSSTPYNREARSSAIFVARKQVA